MSEVLREVRLLRMPSGDVEVKCEGFTHTHCHATRDGLTFKCRNCNRRRLMRWSILLYLAQELQQPEGGQRE